MMTSPPTMAADDKGSPLTSQSTIATRNMVRLRVGEISYLDCKLRCAEILTEQQPTRGQVR